MPTVAPQSRKYRRIVGLIVIGLIIVIGISTFVVQRARTAFEKSYGAYVTVANEYANTAYVPAAPNNPARARVNRLLFEVMAKETSSSDRLARAQEGLTRLEEIEVQIDAMGSTGEQVTAAIDAMEHDAHRIGNLLSRSHMNTLIEQARRQVSIVSDIRGLSYRANFETAQIFERVIDDGGALTDAHVIALNEQLPAVEKDFDQRTNLYSELKSLGEHIQQTHGEL